MRALQSGHVDHWATPYYYGSIGYRCLRLCTFVAVNNRRTFHPLKQWEDIEGSGLMDFSFGPPPAVTCCNLATGATIIDWWSDCFPETDWQKIPRRSVSAEGGGRARTGKFLIRGRRS